MTGSARWFVDVSDTIFAGIGALTNDAIYGYLDDRDGLERTDVLYLQVAYGFDPEPVTPQHFSRRDPYSNPRALERHMEEAVKRGFLVADRQGQYRLTANGQRVAKDIFAFADETFGNLHPLPDDDMKHIAALLSKVVEAAKALPEPAEKWALSWGTRFDRGPSAPFLVRVRRGMLDLLAFRDDVHIAAWLPYESSGRIWESFSYIWRGDAATASDLAEKLAEYRGYDKKAYGAALLELASRGWIAEQDGKYFVTDAGNALRLEAEATTDRYFDAAWNVLSEVEVKDVQALLESLAGEVKPAETGVA